MKIDGVGKKITIEYLTCHEDPSALPQDDIHKRVPHLSGEQKLLLLTNHYIPTNQNLLFLKISLAILLKICYYI